MLLYNILQNVERVIFVGNYLCGNKMSMQMLAYAMDYWSRNTIKALFLEHEGYFGALGSMLFHLDPDCTQWKKTKKKKKKNFEHTYSTELQ